MNLESIFIGVRNLLNGVLRGAVKMFAICVKRKFHWADFIVLDVRKKLMTRDERLIKLTLKVAEKSRHRFRMGAIITIGNCILSLGINKYRTHPRQINWHINEVGWSIHAELDAIISCHKTDGASIYVARLLRNGETGTAKPCKFCQRIIESAGIKRVIFTTYNGFSVL